MNNNAMHMLHEDLQTVFLSKTKNKISVIPAYVLCSIPRKLKRSVLAGLLTYSVFECPSRYQNSGLSFIQKL